MGMGKCQMGPTIMAGMMRNIINPLKLQLSRTPTRIFRRMVIMGLIFVSIIILSSGICSAENCFEEAGLTYNISPLLLYAIAHQESNLKPDAINYNTYTIVNIRIVR